MYIELTDNLAKNCVPAGYSISTANTASNMATGNMQTCRLASGYFADHGQVHKIPTLYLDPYLLLLWRSLLNKILLRKMLRTTTTAVDDDDRQWRQPMATTDDGDDCLRWRQRDRDATTADDDCLCKMSGTRMRAKHSSTMKKLSDTLMHCLIYRHRNWLLSTKDVRWRAQIKLLD